MGASIRGSIVDLGPSTRYLAGRVDLLAARVAAAVARRRADDPDPDDRFRGLYISDGQVDALLREPPVVLLAVPPPPDATAAAEDLERRADEKEAGGVPNRLRELARTFVLDPLDVEVLLVALAPDLQPRFERLYGYLHDDVSRRRASIGLALELCAPTPLDAAARARLEPAGPLVAGGLVLVEDPDRPFLTRALRVPDRVAAHLLGDDTPDPAIVGLLAGPVPPSPVDARPIGRALEAGRLVYLRERPGSMAWSVAAAAFRSRGTEPVLIDLARIGPGDDLAAIAAAAGIAAREARLRGTGLIAGPVDAFVERGAAAVRAFAEAPCRVVLIGGRGWDPGWSRDVPLLLDAPASDAAERATVWRDRLDGTVTPDLDEAIATLPFRLAPEQVARAAAAAQLNAVAAARPLETRDLSAGARAQNAAGLERLARRIEPLVGWEDLVLPPLVGHQLRELAARARHRELVLDAWGMGRRSSKGRGITALFAGDSGTGKTMSAEVIAHDLGLDLYVIDLSTVVDKYIGETEKNLDRVFAEADRVNGVLLFDEADAIFGKRSEVRDARDRYANVEVAYLLQRMELFDGMAILTTNLRSNVDEAFTRRLDAIVDFPMPDESDRLRLWRAQLPASTPQAPDIDLEFLARAFRLSGGNIRNIAIGAAYLAAAGGGEVGMADLILATEREYRKLGRLLVEAEFGSYYGLLDLAAGDGAFGQGSGAPVR
jgi:hypothetical protein